MEFYLSLPTSVNIRQTGSKTRQRSLLREDSSCNRDPRSSDSSASQFDDKRRMPIDLNPPADWGLDDELCIGRILVKQRDFQTLVGNNWLNDEIMNGWLTLL